VDRLRTLADDADAFVQDLSGDDATLVVRAPAADDAAAEKLERELRLCAYELLRADGVYA
jgi:hypothetical protein